MRLTKEQATENRQRIIETAGRLFRESGFNGVSVADLMKAAGFTHGGFYNHFPSKEALAASAALAGLQRSNATLTETLREQAGPDHPPLWPFIQAHLSGPHPDKPAAGRPIPSLAHADALQSPQVPANYAQGTDEETDNR